MVADSPDGNKLRNITAPFYTDKDGNIRKFIPQKEHKQTFTLNKRKKNWIRNIHYTFGIQRKNVLSR